jgi:acetyltransferase
VNHPALDAILKPKSVAVVGASATPGKIGYTVVINLIKTDIPAKSSRSTPRRVKSSA